MAGNNPRRQRENDRHRDEIIEAAVQTFYQQGYGGASVQEIARAAQFGVGTLYRLFPDGKDGLFRAMQERVVTAFENELAGVIEGAVDEAEVIRRYIQAAARVYERHPREMAVYMKHIAGVGLDLSKGLPEDLARRFEALVRVASRAVRAGMNKGIFRPMNPAAVTLSLRAMINVWFLGYVEGAWAIPPTQAAAMVADLFFRGVTPGMNETDRRTMLPSADDSGRE
jgi:AcrR family transcriptional regulator